MPTKNVKNHSAMKIIARKKEMAELERLYSSGRSEFVIIYGRRRIGKTFLVNHLFGDRITLGYVGARNQPQKMQLQRFATQLGEASGSMYAPLLASWEEAFMALRKLIELKPHNERKLIFFDEMPWIDTPRSSFVAALEYFWNGWAAQRDDIMFVACGSATSWMVDKLVKNRGGLHNRITAQIYLRPFSLGECEEMLHANGCLWDRYTITQCYMALGGVPFYLTLLNGQESLAQNLDRLFFAKNARMSGEFEELFNALFPKADKYIAVIKVLAGHREGMIRADIISATAIEGGELSKILENLRRCDFIEVYSRYKSSVRNALYRICDPYVLFYFKFISGNHSKDERFWSNNIGSRQVSAWQGFSFETVCMQHLPQIKLKLGIAGIATTSCSWRKIGSSTEQGAQIDLLIDRADRVINVCEMKFSETPYSITKEYEEKLRTKMAVFRQEMKATKTLLLTMVTTFGVMQGLHSGIVHNEVVMDDLFL